MHSASSEAGRYETRGNARSGSSPRMVAIPLNVDQFDLATKVNGALDGFLIKWIVQIEHEKHDKVDRDNHRALVRSIKKVEGLRNFLSLHFIAKPNSRFYELRFGKPLCTARLVVSC
jgi:hypothetical protein